MHSRPTSQFLQCLYHVSALNNRDCCLQPVCGAVCHYHLVCSPSFYFVCTDIIAGLCPMVARFYLKVYKHSCVHMASTGIVFAVSGLLLHNRLRLFTHSLVRYWHSATAHHWSVASTVSAAVSPYHNIPANCVHSQLVQYPQDSSFRI